MASWKQTAVPSIARKLFIIVLLLIFLEDHAMGGDIASDTMALLAFKEAVGTHLKWNQTTNPCTTWLGINCTGSRVTEVRLTGVGLDGSIPSGILGNLSELRILSLRWNLLSGSVPSDLSNCTQLRNLNLQNNRFSGPLSSFFSGLPNLVRLNLAFNRFTGPIPSSLNNFKRLGTLYLQNNSLTGPIPVVILPNLQKLNVSNNKLSGSVPSTLQNFPSNSFIGNSLCGLPLASCVGVSPALAPKSGQ